MLFNMMSLNKGASIRIVQSRTIELNQVWYLLFVKDHQEFRIKKKYSDYFMFLVLKHCMYSLFFFKNMNDTG